VFVHELQDDSHPRFRLASLQFWRFAPELFFVGEKKVPLSLMQGAKQAARKCPVSFAVMNVDAKQASEKAEEGHHARPFRQRPSRNARDVMTADIDSALLPGKPHFIARSAASKTRVLVTKLSVPTA
jgi:hypothetical protein